MPALVLGSALGSGLLKFPLGGTAITVLFCEEDRSILAEDLRLPVAEEALGPLVPGAHPPVGVHHKDGIVLGGLHQALEAFLALLERLLRTPLVSVIVVLRTSHTASLSHTVCPRSTDYSPECVEVEFSEVRVRRFSKVRVICRRRGWPGVWCRQVRL